MYYILVRMNHYRLTKVINSHHLWPIHRRTSFTLTSPKQNHHPCLLGAASPNKEKEILIVSSIRILGQRGMNVSVGIAI